MRKNLIVSSLAALVIAAQPLWIAPAWAQNQNQNQNQADPNQNQNQTEGRTQTQSENQNQNQNQGDGDDDGDGDGGDDEGTPTLTRDEASALPNYVCFYADAGVTGEAFCSEVGGYSMELSDEWDNRISSIEIVGAVKVTVCTDDNYGDTCAEFIASTTTLPVGLDNAISSWKAE